MSEIEKYQQEVEKEREPFNFLAVEFLLDVRTSQKRYEVEYKGDPSFTMSFDEWLDRKKFEAAKHYIKHHKLNVQ